MSQEQSPKMRGHLHGYPGSPLLVVLSGPSGVGKDAVLRHMQCFQRPWHFTVTATTRPQRSGEKHGIDYFFLEPPRFQDMVDRGEFLEHALVYGNWYGVPKEQVRKALTGGLDVIIKADVQGAATIKEKMPQSILVFLAPPSLKELRRRLSERQTEPIHSLELRTETGKKEMEHLPIFDYVVVNSNQHPDEAATRLDAIITAEKCRIPPRCATL